MLQPTSCGPGPPPSKQSIKEIKTTATKSTGIMLKESAHLHQQQLHEQQQKQQEPQEPNQEQQKHRQRQQRQHKRQREDQQDRQKQNQQQRLSEDLRMNKQQENQQQKRNYQLHHVNCDYKEHQQKLQTKEINYNIIVHDDFGKMLQRKEERRNIKCCWQQYVNKNNNRNNKSTEKNYFKIQRAINTSTTNNSSSYKIDINASKNSTSKSDVSTTTMTETIAFKWMLWLLMLLACLAFVPTKVTAEKSKHYYMQSLCKNHFLQQLYRKIDGAVLWSQNERNLDCIITFQTHSILQRFMLRFDMLQLDCNDHLYVYDGAHAVSTPKVDISCRNTKQSVSSILTRTNFVTLKYMTDGWGTDANGFKLVITSVKDPKHTCKDFTCATREFCVHPDLLCDGVNHCGDNSDESVHNLCQSQTSSTIMGLEMIWFVLIVVCSLLILSACIVGWSICICRRSSCSGSGSISGSGNMSQNTALQMDHAAESNGSSKYLHHQYHGTLTRDHTTLPPTSGNWHHPAGPFGYHRFMQQNLLKMATKVRHIWCLANFVN